MLGSATYPAHKSKPSLAFLFSPCNSIEHPIEKFSEKEKNRKLECSWFLTQPPTVHVYQNFIPPYYKATNNLESNHNVQYTKAYMATTRHSRCWQDLQAAPYLDIANSDDNIVESSDSMPKDFLLMAYARLIFFHESKYFDSQSYCLSNYCTSRFVADLYTANTKDTRSAPW